MQPFVHSTEWNLPAFTWLLLRAAPRPFSQFTGTDIKRYSITDERSAAFFALGIADATQKPVVIICTSGSAVLNLAPALAEAYYRNVPIIAITADRPPTN